MDLFTEIDVDRLIKHIYNKYDASMPLVLWVDLFCGFGGVAEGYKKTKNNFIVAAVNHDARAIEINIKNHPNTIHYVEDVRDWQVIWKIASLIKQLKEEFPEAIIGLHASLECTFFSIAKGGESRDEDSRTLGYHLEKYLQFSPDIITIENVKEFLKWGPVYHVFRDKDGVREWKYKEGSKIYWLDTPNNKLYPKFTLPVKEKESEDYNKWKNIFTANGYDYDYRILNAADFGEHTRRVRYFGVFTTNNLPICFPEPTHVSSDKAHLFPKLKPHKPVYEKLNLNDVGASVFGLTKQNKVYSPKTITRVLGGLKKFKNEGYFLSSYYGTSQNGQGTYSVTEPLNTITTKDRFSLHHIQYAYSNAMYSRIDQPLGTITTVPKAELITTSWLFDTQFKNTGSSINRPCPTIIARQDKKPLYLATATRVKQIDNSAPKKGDSKEVLELKEYMRENRITDITIRSLYDYELAIIQGFPTTYILDKSSTRSKKFIGNSVCPNQALANSNALYSGIVESKLKQAI